MRMQYVKPLGARSEGEFSPRYDIRASNPSNSPRSRHSVVIRRDRGVTAGVSSPQVRRIHSFFWPRVRTFSVRRPSVRYFGDEPRSSSKTTEISVTLPDSMSTGTLFAM